ncbi:MAG: type ISP restriction/modification enzyme, partial [Aggregatilineales bacterium]
DYPLSEKGRRPNLNKKFVDDFAAKIGLDFVTEGIGDLEKNFGPEAIFYYAYAMFHSPTYRSRYAEFLKIDFPRLPLTSDIKLFKTLMGYGETLVQYHLLKHQSLKGRFGLSVIAFDNLPEKEENRVVHSSKSKRRHDAETQRMYINKTQYFGGITAEDYEFYVGGYQVLDKWLKDRKNRALSDEDVQHYKRIVLALRATRELMVQIDEAIGSFPVQ